MYMYVNMRMSICLCVYEYIYVGIYVWGDACVYSKEIPASVQGWPDRVAQGLVKASWVL